MMELLAPTAMTSAVVAMVNKMTTPQCALCAALVCSDDPGWLLVKVQQPGCVDGEWYFFPCSWLCCLDQKASHGKDNTF